MMKFFLRQPALIALALAGTVVAGGCISPGPTGTDGNGSNNSNDNNDSTVGEGQLTVDGVGSFPLSYMYFEPVSGGAYHAAYINLTSEELDAHDVVPDGASRVWLELRSPTWPPASGTYTHELDDGTNTPAAMTFEGDVDWGDDWDEIVAGSEVTVTENDGVYTISGEFNGDFGRVGTFSLTATPSILGEPDEVPDEKEPALGVDVQYEATVSGALTGSFAGSATLQQDNPYEGMYRFAFGVDDLTSEPPTSLALVLIIDTYNSSNAGLAETAYPISGEIGGTVSETDVARFVEQTNRQLHIGDKTYRFAGTATNPGTLTLTGVTASTVEGSFSMTGPFEVSTGDAWESVGEATLTTDFIIER